MHMSSTELNDVSLTSIDEVMTCVFAGYLLVRPPVMRTKGPVPVELTEGVVCK